MSKAAETTEGKDKEDAKAPVAAIDATENGSAKAAQPKKPQGKPSQAETVQKPLGKKMIVRSLVNMSCPDGTELVIGKKTEIPREEHERLQKDVRGPFYEVL